MKMEKIKHIGVDEDGRVVSGGAVKTKGDLIVVKGGCDLEGCHCSDGYSISIIMPLKDGIVEGIKIKFKDLKELEECLK